MAGPGARGPDQAYGVAAITKLMRGIDFPCTRQDLIEHVGDEVVEWKIGERIKLRDCLQQVKQDRFTSAADLASAIGNAISGGRTSTTEAPKFTR